MMGADGRPVGRRDFLRTGVASGAALAGGLAARPVARRGKARCASRTSSSAGRRARSSTRRISSASEDGRPSTPSCRAPRRVS